MFLKHSTIFETNKIIETQHKIIETQHNIIDTIINAELMCGYPTYNPVISQPLTCCVPNSIVVVVRR